MPPSQAPAGSGQDGVMASASPPPRSAPAISSSSCCAVWPTTSRRWWMTPAVRSGASAGDMREANRRWQAMVRSRRTRGALARYRSVLGQPESRARRTVGDLECEALAWRLPLWPDLRFEVLAAAGSGAVWNEWLVRAPGAPAPTLRTVADLRPWACTVEEVARAFPPRGRCRVTRRHGRGWPSRTRAGGSGSRTSPGACSSAWRTRPAACVQTADAGLPARARSAGGGLPLLAAGRWPLAAGCWLLAAGCGTQPCRGTRP